MRKKKQKPVTISLTDRDGCRSASKMPAGWKEAKELHPGMVVFWREGDEYALYAEDAAIAVPLFLPRCTTGPDDIVRIPMKDLEKALSLFLKGGHRVAVCENMNGFDENTPPPRRRPVGEPAPRLVDLPAGENGMNLFERWDREGRIPEGSTLCELREEGRMECLIGASLEGTDIDRDWRIVSSIRQKPGKRFIVMSRR